MTEDEMAGWHHRLDGREFEWIPGVGAGQGGLACCDSWGLKGSDTTERLNWTELKHKENIKKAKEKQQVTYKGNPIYLTADLSAETLQVRREWQDIFKVLKRKNLESRLQYPVMISFKIDGKIKRFSDKQVNRIQYQQTSFTINVKGTYILKKYKRRKKICKINPK